MHSRQGHCPCAHSQAAASPGLTTTGKANNTAHSTTHVMHACLMRSQAASKQPGGLLACALLIDVGQTHRQTLQRLTQIKIHLRVGTHQTFRGLGVLGWTNASATAVTRKLTQQRVVLVRVPSALSASSTHTSHAYNLHKVLQTQIQCLQCNMHSSMGQQKLRTRQAGCVGS